MLEKRKFPQLNRAQRRDRSIFRMDMGKAAGASLLLQRLLIVNGYWPDNSFKVPAKAADITNDIVAPGPAIRTPGKSIAGRAWGKLKSFFGRAAA